MRDLRKLKDAEKWISFIIWAEENNEPFEKYNEKVYLKEAIKALEYFIKFSNIL